MNIVAITQARFNSSRLPGKVLMPLGTTTVLSCHLQNIKKSNLINNFWVATTEEQEAQQIKNISIEEGYKVYQGSTDDVLDRYYQCALKAKADVVVRLTSDCPIVNAEVIDQVITCFLDQDLDYCSNTLNPTYPDGMDCEVFTFKALETAWKQAELRSEREHVTPYIWKNSTAKGEAQFKSLSFESPKDMSEFRVTLDENNDYELLKIIVTNLGETVTPSRLAEFLSEHPEVYNINSKIKRNEGLAKSIAKDTV